MLSLALSAAVLLADQDDPYRDKKLAWLFARAAAENVVRADGDAAAKVRAEYAPKIAEAEAKKKAADAEVRRLKGMKVPTDFGSFKKYGDALDMATAELTRLREARGKAEAAADVRKRAGVVAPSELAVGFFGKVNPKGEPVNSPFKVARVIDGNTAVVEWGEQTLWVEHKGKALSAGQAYTQPGWVYATGSRVHTTSLGATRSVLVVKLVD